MTEKFLEAHVLQGAAEVSCGKDVEHGVDGTADKDQRACHNGHGFQRVAEGLCYLGVDNITIYYLFLIVINDVIFVPCVESFIIISTSITLNNYMFNKKSQ